MYGSVFGWLVRRLEKFLSPRSSPYSSDDADNIPVYQIGVLDIFGFEHFEVNRFVYFSVSLT